MSFPATAEHARSESRSSRASQVAPGEQAGVVHSTLRALEQDLNRTTEVIRRHQQQQMMDKRTFQGEMEVSGRIEVEPQEKWLNLHLRSVSTEDLKKELAHVKEDQRQNAYQDTLAALVYDVNATAEVLRRGSLKRKKPKSHEEVEYRLRLTPAPDEEELYHREEAPPPMEPEEDYTVEHVKKDYDVDLLDESQISSLKRRARSATPRRTLNIEPAGPIGPIPVCAYCQEEIDGPVLTALAPNAEKAQKFHPYHFMCCYCQKALNLHGTFREHERRPYCHDCFYKLWNGLVYEPDINQRKIEKLI